MTSNPRAPRTAVAIASLNGFVGTKIVPGYGFNREDNPDRVFERLSAGVYDCHSDWFLDPAVVIIATPHDIPWGFFEDPSFQAGRCNLITVNKYLGGAGVIRITTQFIDPVITGGVVVTQDGGVNLAVYVPEPNSYAIYTGF